MPGSARSSRSGTWVGSSGTEAAHDGVRQSGARPRELSTAGGARKTRQEGTVVPYAKDPRVDAYIDALPGWQQNICRRVRDLVHAADPDVVETIKRRVQPYFVLDGNICALLAAHRCCR